LSLRAVVAYGLLLVLAIVAFLLIRSYGETLPSGTGISACAGQTGMSGPPAAPSDTFLRVLIALTAIIITGRVLAKLFAYLSQPPVIGEVVAGILLGPSLLGPEISGLVLPPSVAPYLGAIAQLGVVLYMFLVGLELNPALLRQRAHATVATSHASIVVPFLLGALLALPLYPRLSTSDVPFTSFALFMGVAMAITAFPVLARILTDYGMTRTKLGVVALSCAAVDDVTAWCLLAFVVGVARAQIGEGLLVAAGAVAVIAFMFLVARPVLAWVTRRWGEPPHPNTLPRSGGEGEEKPGGTGISACAAQTEMSVPPSPSPQPSPQRGEGEDRTDSPHSASGRGAGGEGLEPSRTLVTLLIVALLLSAIAAEAIGIHAIFGAFLLGAVIPHDSPAARALTCQLGHIVSILFLPAFFAFTGMRTRIDLLTEPSDWLICGVIILVATLGKFGGTLTAARLTGLTWRDAALLGALMNTRGLMELIVLNVGLDLHVISPTLFSMMVVMALVTTGLTSPVLRVLRGQSREGEEEEVAVEAEVRNV
jgi:Kef-type K+ transport system membrane component KefB